MNRIGSRYGISINTTSLELIEVNGSHVDVVKYKALQLPENHFVEDTMLSNLGVQTKFKLDELRVGDICDWVTRIGMKSDGYIYIYAGVVSGQIVEPQDDGDDFDCVFVPDGTYKTLTELGSDKDNYSARARAILCMIKNQPEHTFKISEIGEWKGSYQPL